MDDLMLHVLDLAMNALAAGARTIKISVVEDSAADRVRLTVADNGPGMSADLVRRVLDEYATTKVKAANWVGFGIALLRGTCDLTDGLLKLISREGRGTLVVAEMRLSHPDIPPLGNVAESLQALLVGCGGTDVCFAHRIDRRGYRVDTRTVRRVVGDAFGSPLVRQYLVDQIRDGESSIAPGSVS